MILNQRFIIIRGVNRVKYMVTNLILFTILILESSTFEETPFMPLEPFEDTSNNSFKGSLEAQEERAFRHWVEQGRKKNGSSRIIGIRNGKGISCSFY